MANAEGGDQLFSKEDPWSRQQESQSQNLLKQRIEALEEEKSRLMSKIEEQNQKIKQLMGVIEECKQTQEDEVDWLQLELGSASSAESEVAEEKAAFVERIGRWRKESEACVCNLQEMEIVRLRKGLEEWKVKNLEMEKKIVGLERVIEAGKEWGAWWGMKLPWPAAALAWTAVAATMIFLRCNEQRRR